MGFDRSKYQAASLSDIKKQQETHEQVRPSSGNNDVHDIKAGKNWFRIAPFHPDKGGSAPWEPKCVSWLDVQQQKRDENKRPIEGQFEVRAKPIFNSRVHAGFEFDMVETYMKVAKEIAIPNFTEDKKVQEKIWKSIVDFNAAKKKSGIKPVDTWECYAWNESGKLASLSLKKSMKEAMNELAINAATDPATTDPFSDPDYGIPIVITKTVGATALETTYKVEFAETAVNDGKGRITKTTEPRPLTDQQLQQLDKVKSLFERFVGSFKRKDFDWQIEGLENVDKKLKEEGFDIGVMQYNEFLDVAQQIDALLPEETAEVEEDQQETAAPAAKTPTKPAVPSRPAPAPRQQVRKAPVIQQQEVADEGQEEQDHEEEVQEPIQPKKLGNGKSVNVAKTPAPKEDEGPKGAHIDSTQSALDRIKARMKK